ncbi:MAG TPA: leucyl aminopeptidase [Candidatus Binatia bacterium]|nr:leucyl aminopeptidase [Candidatus Binatia bacterium]
MEITFRDLSVERVKTELLVIPVEEKKLDAPVLRALDRRLKGNLRVRMEKGKFTGAEGTVLLYGTAGMLAASQILLIGLGSGEIATDTWRRTGARARKEAAASGINEFAVLFTPDKDPDNAAGALVEGALLASYQFNKYRPSSKPMAEVKSLTLFRPGLKKTATLEKSVRVAQALAPSVFLARDLVNEPPSVATARYLGAQAESHCHGRGLKVEVWNKKKIESMQLAGLLAVNRGSLEEPRFIKIHYRPPGKPKKKVALIGKGITFDSGGLSLKPSKSMETMKLDMAGGAAVIATMVCLPKLGLDIEVTGYVPTTDNLPGHNAQKPGDVIRYLNGKTIEVLNTDAEGRLILADALALAAAQKPDCMINLATLTGACMTALGTQVAGLFSNDQPLANRLLHCSQEAGEKLWQLPLVKEYKELIKSSVADMKNIGGAHGGAITAALILQEFVGDIPWAHLDIAGPAFAESDNALGPKGGTGFGVRTLVKFLLNS